MKDSPYWHINDKPSENQAHYWLCTLTERNQHFQGSQDQIILQNA